MWPEAQKRIASPTSTRGRPRKTDSRLGRARAKARRPAPQPTGTRSLDGNATVRSEGEAAPDGLLHLGGRDLAHDAVVSRADAAMAWRAGRNAPHRDVPGIEGAVAR